MVFFIDSVQFIRHYSQRLFTLYCLPYLPLWAKQPKCVNCCDFPMHKMAFFLHSSVLFLNKGLNRQLSIGAIKFQAYIYRSHPYIATMTGPNCEKTNVLMISENQMLSNNLQAVFPDKRWKRTLFIRKALLRNSLFGFISFIRIRIT